jgi:hypothetical protein
VSLLAQIRRAAKFEARRGAAPVNLGGRQDKLKCFALPSNGLHLISRGFAMASFSRRPIMFFGFMLVFAVPTWIVWLVGPQLWSDLAHRPFSNAVGYETDRLTCMRQLLVINHCQVDIRAVANHHERHVMHFLAFGEWGDQALRVVESNAGAHRVTISQALDHLADRLFAFLTLNLVSMLLGVALVDKQIKDGERARLDDLAAAPIESACLVELYEIGCPTHLAEMPLIPAPQPVRAP